MTKYRESKASQTTKTYNRNELESNTKNIYEALSIIAKRSQQINLDIKKELHEKKRLKKKTGTNKNTIFFSML